MNPSHDVQDMLRRRLHMLTRQRPIIRYLLYSIVTLSVLYFFHRTAYPHVEIEKPIPPVPKPRPTVHHLPFKSWADSAEQVKKAFLHAYHGYEKYAAPNDELKPLSETYSNVFNGWGVTAFDSLDTMHLMGLHEEFKRATELVRHANFTLPEPKFAPYFETIIRYLGGLLSAYALSHDTLFLDRADELATKLDPVFHTESGLPYYSVNPTNGKTQGIEIGILAELASLQLEYTYLAKLTQKEEHLKRSNRISDVFDVANLSYTGGMLPIRWNLTDGRPFDYHLSVGAQADSAHEYLLKLYLLTAKTDKRSLEMYIRATTRIITDLLYLSPTRHLLYVTDKVIASNGEEFMTTHVFEHLSCFLPGLLALGAHTLPLDRIEELGVDPKNLDGSGRHGFVSKSFERLAKFDLRQVHLWAAEGLAQTCWLTYADQETGLGPDEVLMRTTDGQKTWDEQGKQWRVRSDNVLWIDALERWKASGSRGSPPGGGEKKPIVYTNEQRLSGHTKGRDYAIKKTGYLLRPETIESFYILWRVTGDERWRQKGWRIFEGIETETRTTTGYASLRSVEVSPAPKEDDMPSYFLAETLKYLYLLFSDEDVLPLDKWVFNTEAHPFPVFEWTDSDRTHLGI